MSKSSPPPENDQDSSRGRRHPESALIQPKRASFVGGLWSSFLAGVVVAAPIGITIALVYWFVTGPMAKLDFLVKRQLPDGGSTIETVLQVLPGVGVFVAFVTLVILGAFAKNFVGRSFIRSGERLFESVPVVRNLYGFFKNVFETALAQSDRSFKEVALIEYPRSGSWAMAFVVGGAKGEIKEKLNDQGEELTALFVPTVPNPTSGFLLFLPRQDLRILDMSIEEAAKVVFSLGLVVPDYTPGQSASDKDGAVISEVRKEPLRNRLFGGSKKQK